MLKLFEDTGNPEKRDKSEGKERIDDPNRDNHVRVIAARGRYFERRIKSELALEESLPWHFNTGDTYHCFSFGDVDALTYLRVIIKQQRVEYALLSTWCMSITDAEEIAKWLKNGDLGRIDFYVGEIFQASYAPVFLRLSEIVRDFAPPRARSYIPQPQQSDGRLRREIRLCHSKQRKRKHQPAKRGHLHQRGHVGCAVLQAGNIR